MRRNLSVPFFRYYEVSTQNIDVKMFKNTVILWRRKKFKLAFDSKERKKYVPKLSDILKCKPKIASACGF